MNFMMYVLLGATLTLTSCIDDEKNPPKPGEKTTDLYVPADFDWQTTRSVKLTFTDSPVDTRLSIHLDPSCNEESRVAALNITKESKDSISVDVPNSAGELYVKYPTEKGSDTFTLRLTDAHTRASQSEEFVIPLDGVQGLYQLETGTDADELSVCTTYGTLIFEDNWPALGDYDFNDLVANYKIESHISLGSSDQYKNERIEVAVTFRAVGGYHPSKLGLQFLGIDKKPFFRLRNKHIDRIEGLDVATKGITVKLENEGPEEFPVFVFEGLNSLRKGENYYNTEKVDDEDLVTVTFTLHFNLENKLSASSAVTQAAAAKNQDFFLITNEGREIHLKGYGPSALYKNYETDMKQVNAEQAGKEPYCTDKNLVWGLKLPWAFSHPKEKVDIVEAYTDFRGWVESNGADYKNWYKSPAAGKVIPFSSN